MYETLDSAIARLKDRIARLRKGGERNAIEVGRLQMELKSLEEAQRRAAKAQPRR